MSSLGQVAVASRLPAGSEQGTQWFAIQTRARHEKKVRAGLQERGIETFLPLVRQTRLWSDRRKEIEFPLFSCYAFVHIVPTPQTRLAVLNTPGALSFVGVQHRPTPIPRNQIEYLRTAVLNQVPLAEQPFIKLGQRVRIRGGALEGIEGILVAAKSGRRLVLSIEPIERSVSFSIEGYDIEPV
jgi:transcription antitermination factor NusG